MKINEDERPSIIKFFYDYFNYAVNKMIRLIMKISFYFAYAKDLIQTHQNYTAI
jgi:hypothetical protein